MSFVDPLRLAISLGLALFLVLLRFDADRITRSDYFRYRTPWMGPVSYYILVLAFAIGIAIILPSGRAQLFLTGGETDEMLPVMLVFVTVALLNAVDRYRPGRGPGFVAFAVPTITGVLKRYFRDCGWVVRPPRRVQERRAEVLEAEGSLRQDLGREPTAHERATRSSRWGRPPARDTSWPPGARSDARL